MVWSLLGDIVEFQVAKDRRDGLLHATSINLVEDSFIVSKEKRDKGIIMLVFSNMYFYTLTKSKLCLPQTAGAIDL